MQPTAHKLCFKNGKKYLDIKGLQICQTKSYQKCCETASSLTYPEHILTSFRILSLKNCWSFSLQ